MGVNGNRLGMLPGRNLCALQKDNSCWIFHPSGKAFHGLSQESRWGRKGFSRVFPRKTVDFLTPQCEQCLDGTPVAPPYFYQGQQTERPKSSRLRASIMIRLQRARPSSFIYAKTS